MPEPCLLACQADFKVEHANTICKYCKLGIYNIWVQFVLQLRMSLDIFHSITNISLLIACLLHVKLLVTCKRCGLWKDFIFYHNANPQMSCTFCAFYQFSHQIVRNSQVNQPSTGRLCTISLARLPLNIPPPPPRNRIFVGQHVISILWPHST